MRLLTRVAMVFVAGSAIAWLLALFHGFSSDRQLCFNSAHNGCGTSISWTDNRVLWLAPVAIVMVIVVIAVSTARKGAAARWVVAVVGLAGVAAFVVGSANGVSEADCQIAVLNADAAAAKQDSGALADAILSKPACFSHSDVKQARQYRK